MFNPLLPSAAYIRRSTKILILIWEGILKKAQSWNTPPPHSQNSLKSKYKQKNYRQWTYIPPCIIFWMRQSCYINPTIIELYRWKEIYLDKENLCITTGVLVCFSLGRGGHSMIGGSKKFNWIIYIPLQLFIYYFPI